MRFAIPCSNQVQLSIAAAHGFSDAARPPAQLLLYGLALLPIPGKVVTSAFAAASVTHFAADVGILGSAALHATVLALASKSYEKAMRFMLAYVTFFHVPLLAVKLALLGNADGLACLLYGILICVRTKFPCIGERQEYYLGHSQQKLVICHVLLSFL